jgi:hypothetical protein
MSMISDLLKDLVGKEKAAELVALYERAANAAIDAGEIRDRDSKTLAAIEADLKGLSESVKILAALVMAAVDKYTGAKNAEAKN